MCDFYPSPTDPILQHLLSYEDYESEHTDYITASGLTITQLDAVPPKHSIRPQEFELGLQGELNRMHDDLTFGYTHHERRISMVFNRTPDFLLLLSLFAIVQSRLLFFELEGIDEVIFNAGKDDEILYQNVSSMLQQNMSIIPDILNQVQTHYRTRYLNN